MNDRVLSPRLVNRLTWVGSLVLVAGVVTFGVVMLGRDDAAKPRTSTPAGQQAPAGDDGAIASAADAVATPGSRKTVPLAPAVRRVAGEFILSAVTRENLAKGWELTHPDLKAECQCSRAEWMTGNIPVQPYPGDALDDASFAIEESYADEAVLQVALLPKDGSEVPSEIFWIGLKKVSDGGNAKWLVYYWAPRATIPVPVAE